jgi:arsenite methyltransferase
MQTDDRKLKILFLCTGNSCRSQMAAGWARHLRPGRIEAHSAGTDPRELDPRAVQVMAEVGVDISGQRPRHVDDLSDHVFDYVITVCGDARESCPVFPGGVQMVHVGFADPPRLAEDAASEQEALAHYRRVRDEIGRFVASLPQSLAQPGTGAEHPPAIPSPLENNMSEVKPSPPLQQIHATVREGYAKIAAGAAGSCCGPSSCCSADAGEAATQLALGVGYDLDELQALPAGANMGLSCGNPVALASLREGETVVDLGSGGGFDVFIAGRKIGPAGRAIGVDMTPEMLQKARANLAGYRESTGLDNVEFRLGEIEHLPLADASADVVISNCVINLSPRKDQVWREVARVLKPGGRVAVSDLALKQPLPEAVAQMVDALIGCVAGAILVDETARLASAAGLAELELIQKREYIDAMTTWQDPLYARIAAALPAGASLGDYVTSLEVRAVKPSA